MDVKTELINQEQQYVLKFIGKLDTISANKIQDKIEEIASSPDKDLVIDCSELEYIASAGLRLFLILFKSFDNAEHAVTLVSVTEKVMKVLSVTNLDKVFEIK